MKGYRVKTIRVRLARFALLLFAGLSATVSSAEDAFFETGSVVVNNSIDGGGWVSVSLRESYTSPVVIVGPVSHSNDNSLSARVRNVTASGFQVGFQSPCESSGSSAGGASCPPGGNWNSETIRYWVVEEGAWAFPDGTRIEAGRLTTATVRSGIGSSNASDTVVFQQAFGSAPAVLHSVNSFIDPDWIASTAFASGNNTGAPPGASDFSLALEGAEVTNSHGAEVVGWVAVESAAGTNNGNAYLAGRSGLVVGRHQDECQGFSINGFSSTPDAVVSHNTMRGTNGGWVRFCGSELTPSGLAVHIDEDQVNDSERTGLEEAVGVFTFEANGTGLLTRPDTFCTGVDALFCDDFDAGTLASDGWTITSSGGSGGNAGIGSQTSNSGSQSLYTYGGQVNVASPVFDLADLTAGTLAYWWRRGDDAFSEDPDNNEDLTVQYLDDNGQWQDIEVLQGAGTKGESGTTEFQLPGDAFHSAFQFRFRQERGNSGFDFWHVDDVVLRAGSFICEPDNFDRSALGPDWVTTRSEGDFSPQLVGGRLRMTQATGNQATAATYQRTFPGADNLIQIEFDYYAYGGTGADGLAVVFSDASVTPQAGGYGGSLGYAQVPNGTGGFAGGWLGIGLDEYGNFSHDSEGRVGGNNQLTPDSVAVRGALPDYAYIADSGALSPGIDANNDNNPYRYRITIDSRNNQTPTLKVERNGSGTGNSFVVVIEATLTSQPSIPTNLLLSLTGSTGGSTNIHELDNLQVCADKVGPVQRQIDHFEIEHSGSSLTCRPEAVTIRACDNPGCSQTYNDPVDVTLAPSSRWVGGNTFTMTGGIATRILRVTTPSTVTLGVPASSPATIAFSQTLCNDGSPGVVSASKCDLEFFDSGFDISVPDHISDTDQPVTVAAVRTQPGSGQCVPGFDSETKSVSLWSGYTNPVTGSVPVLVDGSAVPGSVGPTRSLTFDGNGVATVQLQYADVGRVRLNARYEGSGEEAGLVMNGNADFVARPHRFRLTIPGNPAATGVAAGNDFVAAGADFQIDVAALNNSGNVTPNFGLESPNEGVNLALELIAPSGGDAPPLLGGFGAFGEDCNGNTGTPGAACGQFSWGEVGILRLMPELASGQYLSTQNVTGNAVERVGRFIPDRFNVAVDPGEVEPFCTVTDRFAYSGQSLSWLGGLEPVLAVDALNVQGNITRNYTLGNFLRLTSADIGRSPGLADRSASTTASVLFPVQTSLNPTPLSVVDRGRLQYRFAGTDAITYEKTFETRVAPFTPDYRIEVSSLEDADGVTTAQVPIAIDPVFDFQMRYGRLNLSNAYGPETFDLVVPFEVEYFESDTAGFTRHAADSCWQYNTSTNVALDQSDLSGGSTSVDGVSDTVAEGRPKAGSKLVLTAPGEENRGDVGVTFAVPVWLRDDFDNNTSLDNPSGLATFGVYRGNDRIIHWQEVLN